MSSFCPERACTLSPAFRTKYFSEAGGGGDITADTGTVPDTTIADGPITAGIRRGIKDCPPTGGTVTTTASGAGVPGTRIPFTTARKDTLPAGVIPPGVPRVIAAAVLPRADILPAGGPAVLPMAVLPMAVPLVGGLLPAADIPPEHRIEGKKACGKSSDPVFQTYQTGLRPLANGERNTFSQKHAEGCVFEDSSSGPPEGT